MAGTAPGSRSSSSNDSSANPGSKLLALLKRGGNKNTASNTAGSSSCTGRLAPATPAAEAGTCKPAASGAISVSGTSSQAVVSVARVPEGVQGQQQGARLHDQHVNQQQQQQQQQGRAATAAGSATCAPGSGRYAASRLLPAAQHAAKLLSERQLPRPQQQQGSGRQGLTAVEVQPVVAPHDAAARWVADIVMTYSCRRQKFCWTVNK
jgi:hypothetical protein